MTKIFIPNPLGIAAAGRSLALVQKLGEKAEEIAETAKSIAPVLSGQYRDNIDSESGIDGESALGRVNANDFKSVWIEFGTSDTPAFAPLRRAAEAGGESVQGGK